MQLPRRIRLRREYRLVAQSGIFDAAFYLEQNPSAAQSGIDPLKHYLTQAPSAQYCPHPLFDARWYLPQNTASLPAHLNPLVHYLQRGWKEERTPHPLFDSSYYLEQNPDVARAETNPLEHYLARGALEGRSPHPLFDAAWYLRQNPDIASIGINPLIHYLRQGWQERRNPHPLFDDAFYLENNLDVKQAGICPLEHYVTRGWLEGRAPHPLFDGAWYLTESPDLVVRKTNPLIHYLHQGWKERRDPHLLFDIDFYLLQVPYVARANIDPFQHYLAEGGLEGYSPHPLFDGAWYLNNHPALITHKINPLIHYLCQGWKEYGSPHRLFDTAFYLKQNPQVLEQNLNPLMHYLIHASSEEVDPNPLFDSSYYVSLSGSTIGPKRNPLVHYVLTGAGEHKRPHPVFEPAFYIAKQPDVETSGLDPLSHYLEEGARKRYSPHPLFDPEFYLHQSPGLNSCSDLLVHYLYEGGRAGLDPCELFDSSYYLQQNPDVAKAGINPLVHYLTAGVIEGCKPNPLFDTCFYLRQNPTVSHSGINPLTHFITYGAWEGRFPNPFFDPLYYLRTNPDVKRAGTNPLAHYLLWGGAQEGRDPSRFFSTAAYLSEHSELRDSDVNPLAHFLGYHPPLEQRRSCTAVLTGASIAKPIAMVNDIFRAAAEDDSHLLVLFTVASPSEETVRILTDGFDLDPHIAATIPRQSDPVSGEILKLSSDLGDPELASFPRPILDWIPEYYLLPEMLSCCFLMRNSVVSNFGLLDETYGTVAGALLHYLCRVRRSGFRCAVVNRAIVSVTADKYFGTIPVTEAELRKLYTEYPDAGLAKTEFVQHPLHAHESLLARALSSERHCRQKLLLDIRGVPSQINGTTEAVLTLCDALSATDHDWAITLLAEIEPAQFHKLSKRYSHWKIVYKETDQYFTAALRPSQPWDISCMIELHRMALFNFYTILDTIAWDISVGAPTELNATWTFLSQYADGILYISQYTRDRFATRFPLSKATPEHICYLSFDPNDYMVSAAMHAPRPRHEGFILVAGNAFDHKQVSPTVDLLTSALPHRVIKALGLKSHHPNPLVEALEAGHLPQIEIERLFADAELIVFPSFYEGFGFPVLKGLSYGKTVIARESELLYEVASRYRGPGRLIAFRTPRELVETVSRVLHNSELVEIPLGAALSESEQPINWTRCAEGVLNFIETRIQDVGASRWCARERAIEQMTAYVT